MSGGKAPAVFPAIQPLQSVRLGGYPAFVAAETERNGGASDGGELG